MAPVAPMLPMPKESISPEKYAFLFCFNINANAKIRSMQGPQLTMCWLMPFKSSSPTTGHTHLQGVIYAPDNYNHEELYNCLPMNTEQ